MTNRAQPTGPATPLEVIVIGAGPAARALAEDLRGLRCRFLVLEAGPEVNASVLELARAGDHFEVRTARRSYFARQVVVAAGAFSSTGSRPDYSWITIPGVVSDGEIRHERGVSEVSGIYVLLDGDVALADSDAQHMAKRIASIAGARAESARP